MKLQYKSYWKSPMNIKKQAKVTLTYFSVNCTRNMKPLIVEFEYLLWIDDFNNNKKKNPISLPSVQAEVLNLVATLKENDNYKETGEEHTAAGKGWFHHFRNGHELIIVEWAWWCCQGT